MVKKCNKRQGIVDLWKFIGSIFVMTCHLNFLGFVNNDICSYFELYMTVEMYFIITGYFTFSHFQRKVAAVGQSEQAKVALWYTIKKFQVFLPYVIISAILKYALDYGLKYIDLKFCITNFPFEALLLSDAFAQTCSRNVPIWFLSCMFIVFPLFCLICQISKKYLVYTLSLLGVLLYYGYFGIRNVGGNPFGLIRALAGLCLGIVVYGVAGYMRSARFNALQRVVLTVVEEGVLLLSVYNMYFQTSTLVFNLLCFFVGLSIMFSGQSYTAVICNRLTDLLGKVSLVIYIFHWTVGAYITTFFKTSADNKILLYYLLTLFFSFLIYLIVEKIRNNLARY